MCFAWTGGNYDSFCLLDFSLFVLYDIVVYNFCVAICNYTLSGVRDRYEQRCIHIAVSLLL